MGHGETRDIRSRTRVGSGEVNKNSGVQEDGLWLRVCFMQGFVLDVSAIME